jgi:hypothetical protein
VLLWASRRLPSLLLACWPAVAPAWPDLQGYSGCLPASRGRCGILGGLALTGYPQRPGASVAGGNGYVFQAAPDRLGQHKGEGEAELGHPSESLRIGNRKTPMKAPSLPTSAEMPCPVARIGDRVQLAGHGHL